MSAHYESLVAGPLRALWDSTNGQLRWIMWVDREIVRGVYGAVRDQFWGTVEPSLSDVQIVHGSDSFAVSFKARTSSAEIDFEWAGVIAGEADGTISYSFVGLSHHAFLRQRIGLCVLHPIRECRGQSCRIRHANGEIETMAFPMEVSPHQPFKDVTAISQDLQDGVTVTVAFEGDTFETEDQRNWTDASYKTYCTPLDRPRPVWVQPGEVIRQRVEIRIQGARREIPDSDHDAVLLELGPRLVLPRLGFEHTRSAPDSGLVPQLRTLRPDHLRWTLDLTRGALDSELKAAAELVRLIGTKLHAAITLGTDPEAQLERLAAAVTAVRPPVAAWLVFHGDEASTSTRWVELARRSLGALSPESLFGGGTDQNFAELNRDRRPRTGFDVATFPINPQVHAFDDDSIAETLEVQGDTVATARTFLGSVPIIAGPIVLEPRYAPDRSRNAAVDPRLSAPFSAAWTLGSVAALASAGCEYATFFEVFGPRGLFDRPEATGTSPAAGVFEDLAELGDASWSLLVCAGRSPLTGLAYRTAKSQGMLLANPGQIAVRARLPFQVQRLRPLGAASAGRTWQPVEGSEIVVPPQGALRLEGVPS